MEFQRQLGVKAAAHPFTCSVCGHFHLLLHVIQYIMTQHVHHICVWMVLAWKMKLHCPLTTLKHSKVNDELVVHKRLVWNEFLKYFAYCHISWIAIKTKLEGKVVRGPDWWRAFYSAATPNESRRGGSPRKAAAVPSSSEPSAGKLLSKSNMRG